MSFNALVKAFQFDMSYSPNSLKGVVQGVIEGSTIEVIEGDTKSLDFSSYGSLGWSTVASNHRMLQGAAFYEGPALVLIRTSKDFVLGALSTWARPSCDTFGHICSRFYASRSHTRFRILSPCT